MNRSTRFLLPLAAGVALLIPVGPGQAKSDDDGRVIRTGSCSGATDFKLKAKPDDGRLEVEFEVDQNRNGVRWRVALRRNGAVVARGTRRTRGRSGSFSFERRIANPAGKDRISAVARRKGETCRASLRI
jgi:hypothetical protein